MEKVLVSCPISDKKYYSLDRYVENYSNFTYLDKDIYLVDNSENIYTHARHIVTKYGIDCDWINPKGKRNIEYITESQNKIREKFLSGDYTHLFFLECDIFPPHNIIEELLSYQAPFTVARYMLGNLRFPIHTIGSEIEKSYGRITNRNISTEENFFEYGSTRTRSSMFGFGVALFARDLIEQTPFFYDEGLQSHSDTSFYFWLQEQNIFPVVHDVICEHQNSDWGRIYEQEKNK